MKTEVLLTQTARYIRTVVGPLPIETTEMSVASLIGLLEDCARRPEKYEELIEPIF